MFELKDVEVGIHDEWFFGKLENKKINDFKLFAIELYLKAC